MKNNYLSSKGIAVRLRWQRAKEKAIQAKAAFEKLIAEIAPVFPARKIAAEVEEYNINEADLVVAETKRIHVVGYEPLREHLATGKAAVSAVIDAEIEKSVMQIEKRIGYFIDNGNGTVTDTRTGLTWMRCAMGQIWADTSCQGVTNTYTWNKAMTLCHTFAGHDDWRLPTCDELKAIIDPSQKYPTINADAFPETVSLGFWSSSLSDNDSSRAWINNFKDGNIYVRDKNIPFPVRLVRGGQNVRLLDQKSTAPLVTSAATAAVYFEKPQTLSEKKTATNLADIPEIKVAEEKEQVIKRLLVVLISVKTHRIFGAEKAVLQERVSQVNAVVEKDLAKEKAAAEVAMKIINRLGVALVDTGIQRILGAKKAALQERVAQVNAEIEQVLTTGKAVASAVVAAQKAADAEVTEKEKAAKEKEQIIKSLLVVLVYVKTQRILDAEKAVIRERVAKVHAEIEKVLAAERAVASAVVTAEKAAAEVVAEQQTFKEKEQIIKRLAAMQERVALANIEFEKILATNKIATFASVAARKATVVETAIHNEEERNIIELDSQSVTVPAAFAVTSKKHSERCALCKPMGLHNILRLDPHCIGCEKSSPTLISASNAVTATPAKQNTKCPFCNTLGLHDILRVTSYTIDCHCFACGKKIFISKFGANTVAPTPTTTKPEITQMLKRYDFVLTNEVGPLKAGDQWFEEKAQKRRLRTGSPKAYQWLLPFMPLEVAKLHKNLSALERGPGLASLIAKELRVLIRERRRDKQPYEDLLRALYGACVLIDFAKNIGFVGMSAHLMTCYVDIRELRNVQIDYSMMGYCYNESLLKTDVKWLIEVFGEPDTHQSFDALWPKIRQNAISRYCWKRLLNENKSARSLSIKNAQKSMYEWIKEQIERIGYHHPAGYYEYYQKREKQLQEIASSQDRNHKEWLEQKAARGAQFVAKPIAVKTVKQSGYAIPAPPKPPHSFSLDMSSIATKLAETVAVAAILKDIFSEDVPVPSLTAVPGSTTTEVFIASLDAESFTFMQVLASKQIWTRNELEKLAADHSLMLDGTLDSINDASYDHFGGPFFEGDDPIEINPEFAKEIAA